MPAKEAESNVAMDRRGFCRALAGAAAGTALGVSPASALSVAESEFVIVNGWVLTPQDVAYAGRLPDAV